MHGWVYISLVYQPYDSIPRYHVGVVLIEAHDPFSATKYRNAHEALGLLFQEEDVEEYIEAFEAISILILDQLEEQSIGWFIRRLKNEIRN